MARNGKGSNVMALGDSDAMRYAMKSRGITQIVLADKLGIKQSGLSGSLNRKRTTMDVFKRTLDAMEYDVAVVDRRTGEILCKVAPEE